MCRRERNGNRSPGDLLLKGRVGERAVGLVKMVLHQQFFETHEKMKQLHFSPWYKNISRVSLFHISILRAPLVHRLSVIRQTRRCDWTKPTHTSLGEDSEVPRLCAASCCPWLCLGWQAAFLGVLPFSWEPFPEQRVDEGEYRADELNSLPW